MREGRNASHHKIPHTGFTIRSDAESPWIICGWFTPDYAKWAERLRDSLEAVGAPYELVNIPKAPGGWEANTMRKAEQVLAAMDRHPDKTIIWTDMDAVVTGDLSPLSRLTADVGLRLQAKRRRGRTWIIPRAGTKVINPTHAARRLVEKWVEASKETRWGDVDETPLAIALAETPGVTVLPLPSGSPLASLIAHDTASREHTKVSHFQRATNWLTLGALGRFA